MTEAMLINADCLEALSKIPNDKIDLVLTDPPYNLGSFVKNRDTNLQKRRTAIPKIVKAHTAQSVLLQKFRKSANEVK